MFKLILKILLLFTLIAALFIVGISSGVINISKIDTTNNSILSNLEDIGILHLDKFSLNYVVKDSVGKDTLIYDKSTPGDILFAIINGEVNACINLKEITKGDIKEIEDTIHLFLPAPVLCNAKINYEQSKIYDKNFNPHVLNREIFDKYFPNAINNIKAEAIRMGILDLAKENAKKIVLSILEQRSRKFIRLDFREM